MGLCISKLLDCITFFDNNLMFEIRYNILSEFIDYFVICESKFDHKVIQKTKILYLKIIMINKNKIFTCDNHFQKIQIDGKIKQFKERSF